jgi:serine/threonine protein phosphatase 1
LAEARTIALGDIHGCLAAMHTVLGAVDLRPEDTLVTLGDYVDRGPDSRGVIEQLIALGSRCRLIPLLGNHDAMFLEVCAGATGLLRHWLPFGGHATVVSYGGRVPEGVPAGHIDFVRNCRLLHQSQRHFFVHGSYLAHLPLEDQPADVLLWDSLKTGDPGPHCSGKTAILGHTAQRDGQVLDLGYLKCIDTCCYGEGWLTALEVETGRLWQADKLGRLRDSR